MSYLNDAKELGVMTKYRLVYCFILAAFAASGAAQGGSPQNADAKIKAW